MNISDSDKQALLDGTALIPFKINIIQDGETIKTLDENSIVDIDDEDFRYVNPESIVIGQFVAKKITGNLDKIYSEFSIEDTEIELQMGIKVDDTTTYYSLGNYLVTKPTTDDVKDKTSFEALDYAKKFNKTFDPSGITFPCTAGELAQYCCTKCDVELATTDFTNSDFQIDKNPFDSDVMYRYVMQRIGKLAYSWVRIGYDNKCYIDFEVPTKVTSDFDKVTGANYYDLDRKEKMYGPVNRVVIGMSNVEGENVTVEDTDSINKNGACEIQVMDNELTYTPELRAKVSESAKKLFGLTYLPLEITTTGHPWWTGKELIEITTPDGDTYQTIPLDRTLTYSGHIKTKATSKADTVMETEYKSVPSMESEIRKTRIIVDKDEQKIDAVVENSTKQDQRISDLSVSVDEIKSTVSNITEPTSDNQTQSGNLTFQKVNKSEPIELIIRPTNEDIAYLYANNSLYPSNSTFSKSRDILFKNVSTNEEFKYTLPANLWYLDENTYDEFHLDYVNSKCEVTKRVGWNSNREKYKLSQEEVLTFEYPTISLTSGDYEISLAGYTSGYVYAKLMIVNPLTDTFATKVELESSISQLDNDITLEVDGKLKGKANTEDVNNDIKDLTASLALKVDTENLASEIDAVADKINLTGLTTVNKNFQILTDGSIKAVNGSFTGNIYLNDGSAVIGGKGLLSVLTFESGWNILGPMEKLIDNTDTYTFDQQIVSLHYYIPSNFTIESAYIVLQVTPNRGSVPYDATTNTYYTGIPKNIRLYADPDNTLVQLWSYHIASDYSERISNIDLTNEVKNAFGSASYTPSKQNLGDINIQDTSNLIELGKTNNNDYFSSNFGTFFVRSDYTPNDTTDFDTAMANSYNNMGLTNLILYVYGYMTPTK